MIKRVVTGLFILLGTVGVMWAAGTAVYPVAWAILCVVGMMEYLRVFHLLGKWYFSVPSFLLAAGLPVSCYYLTGYDLATNRGLYLLVACFALYFLWLATFSVFFHSTTPVAETFAVGFGGVYIILAFCSFSLVYAMEGSILLVVPIFIGSWVTDTMAYFSGVLLGRHHFAPELSPKKTVEGSVGGIVGCILATLLYGFVVSRFSHFRPQYWVLAVAAFFISICSQVGDLFMSKIKREHGVKDYGRIFPGHGGVLDRFDSVIAIAPFMLILCFLSQYFSLFA